jgi:hypothetical protein
MWWRPERDDEMQTYSEVMRLSDYFLTLSQRLEFVHGIGSTWDEEGRRVPLLVIDERWRAPQPEDLAERLAAFLRSIGVLPPTAPDEQWRQLFVPFSAAPRELQAALAEWKVRGDTRLLFSPRPVPAKVSPGTHVFTTQGSDATVGFAMRVGDHTLFSTAGHAVAELPCRVSVDNTWLLGLLGKFEMVGAVTFSHDPKQCRGVDIALIEPAPEQPVPSSSSALANPPAVQRFTRVALQGGKSGPRTGWVMAALSAEERLDGRIWSNCWLVSEFDGGFAQRGDSGGPVRIEGNREALGHLVGAMGGVRWGGVLQHGIVQDLETVIQFVAEKYHARVVVLEDGL